MNLSKIDAEKALNDVATTKNRTAKMAEFKGPDAIYAIWGIIWMIAFTAQQFLPHTLPKSGPVQMPISCMPWTPLVIIGIILTIIVDRRRTSISSADDKKIGILWGAAFGYFYLWIFLLYPAIDFDRLYSLQGERIMTALVSTVPMFVYVLMGLMGCGNYMIWLGLAITALTVVGLLFIPAFFFLWMALMGGGGLLLAGVFARRQCREA